MKTQPALLIAGTHSGCGKTTITLGLMAALEQRGYKVQPFKCGPDFIDPTLHQMVTGRISRNLDVRMCGTEFTRYCFHTNSLKGDCAVIEGVMGLFDGAEGSAATLAKMLRIPVILVIDVRSAAESIAAIVKGFSTLDPDLDISGVICNRVGSEKHKALIAEAVVQYCDVPILGFIPRNESVAIPSRHLGLHMGEENPLGSDGINQLVNLIEDHIDLDQLLRLGTTEVVQSDFSLPPGSHHQSPVRIGVARDEAFCFYYEDNLDLLTHFGAQIVFFSPLHDASLPDNIQGLYLGGGYPELYTQKLSNNKTMRNAIRQFCQQGNPVYGECGGFMYLTSSITDLDGKKYPMAEVFPFRTQMQSRLRRLGYRKPMVTRNTFLAPEDTVLHGHEFHYSTIDQTYDDPACCYKLDDGKQEGYLYKKTLAGYLHLHWGKTPQVAENFVEACRHFI